MLYPRNHNQDKDGQKLNANDSYKADEAASLNRQMEDLKLTDETGNYTATRSIIHKLSGKNTRQNVKVKKRDGSAASSEQELLEECRSSTMTMENHTLRATPSSSRRPSDKH